MEIILWYSAATEMLIFFGGMVFAVRWSAAGFQKLVAQVFMFSQLWLMSLDHNLLEIDYGKISFNTFLFPQD
jgi:hypothetical protein